MLQEMTPNATAPAPLEDELAAKLTEIQGRIKGCPSDEEVKLQMVHHMARIRRTLESVIAMADRLP